MISQCCIPWTPSGHRIEGYKGNHLTTESGETPSIVLIGEKILHKENPLRIIPCATSSSDQSLARSLESPHPAIWLNPSLSVYISLEESVFVQSVCREIIYCISLWIEYYWKGEWEEDGSSRNNSWFCYWYCYTANRSMLSFPSAEIYIVFNQNEWKRKQKWHTERHKLNNFLAFSTDDRRW